MYILFVRGINDKNTVRLSPGPKGGMRFAYDGCCGIYWFMNFPREEAEAITLFGSSYPLQQVQYKSKPSLLFNEISDPDSHRGALVSCEQLCGQLGLPVINNPTSILQTTRDRIPLLLQDIEGLEIPRTIRITPRSPEDIFTAIDQSMPDLPVIVRLAGSHGGVSSILINGREDIDMLHVYPYDGSDFYLTQFVDYADDDGFYRKLRMVVIDGVPLYRHLLIDRKWMIHASSTRFMMENESLMQEATALQESFDRDTLPAIRPVIDEITRRLQLEYYGIDCNLRSDGKILVFEINANMNILLNYNPRLAPQLQLIRRHIRAMLDNHAASGGVNQPFT